MKRKLKQTLSLLLILLWANAVWANIDDPKTLPKRTKQKSQFRADCTPPTSSTDMAINNVRARLKVGGEVGTDGTGSEWAGQYIVPNVDPASGYPDVTAIFASGLWIGGFDPADNLKLAAQTYGAFTGLTEYYAGPLADGINPPNIEDCNNWDQIFKITGADILAHIDGYQEAEKNGVTYNPDLIPEAVKGWPARGNPFFEDIHGFSLPNTLQGLAPFFDRDGDELYDPRQGDYPRLELRGCDRSRIPDEMNFHIFNDAAGPHMDTRGEALRMEIQALSFAYQTFDILNNTTLHQYRIISRGVESLDSLHFGVWTDPQLGCPDDDYIGCVPDRNLAFIYNEDAIDGASTDCTCFNNDISGYCETIPLFGQHLVQGPLDEFGNELGMSSFTYYLNGSFDFPSGIIDPSNAVEHYNLLTGSWRDGTPYTYGGFGYNLGNPGKFPYAFSDAPNDPTGWSMCTEDVSSTLFGKRTIQSFGSFRMDPGNTQEIVRGMTWIPDVPHPCPDITPLLRTDDFLKKIFDNCVEFSEGPDAPDVDWVELDREAIAVLTNDENLSNNAFEAYQELDICAPSDLPLEERFYHFEGYKIYQLADPEVHFDELEDPERARLAYQGDLENGISTIYNWEPNPNPDFNPFTIPAIWSPRLMVEGTNEDIQHTIRFTEDLFAEGEDKRLINHRRYYYIAIAYAHNDYASFTQFDTRFPLGQATAYQEGQRNIKLYTVIPRPNSDLELNSQYGDSIAITRISGKGNDGFVLELAEEVRESLFNDLTDGQIPYKKGAGPFEVSIYNPLALKEGTYELKMMEASNNQALLTDSANWQVTHLESGETIRSRRLLGQDNEQVLAEFGISIRLQQAQEPGNIVDNNGMIAFDLSYDDPNSPWLQAFPEGIPGFDYLKNGLQEPDNLLDPNNAFQQITNGFFIPYYLCDYRTNFSDANVSPAWNNGNWGNFIRQNSSLGKLNNIDIVLSANTDLWSRCIVVETASAYYTTTGNYDTEGDAREFALRASPSVGKLDANGDGLPDPDGDGIGMAWFPGYAIDIETGQRLNIFFGENSTYNGQLFPESYDQAAIAGKQLGNDMMWNPSAQLYLTDDDSDIYRAIGGGQQFIYVMNQAYDGCESIREDMAVLPQRQEVLANVTWVGTLLPRANSQYLPYSQGLIPNDVLIKLRVQSAFERGPDDELPRYQFTIGEEVATPISSAPAIAQALESIRVVPNPYYGDSFYERFQEEGAFVKITNLPGQCTVRIYNLAGQFVREFKRNEQPVNNSGEANPGVLESQIYPALNWDLKNHAGKSVGSGVYLIHIAVPGLGERVLKWFGKVPDED
ncbi:MAG: hypothetical protein AAFP19_03825 [Bacteroidota bacterium]